MPGRKKRTVAVRLRPGALGACVAMGLLALAAARQARAGFPSRIVDTGTDPTAKPDVAFGDADEVRVAFRHGPQGKLKLARVLCTDVSLSTLYDVGTPGFTPSLAVDTLGFPSVVHRSLGGPGPGLYYTLDGGELFGLSTVEIDGADAGMLPVYALDSVDRPYVALVKPDRIPRVSFFDIKAGHWVTEPIPAAAPVNSGERNIALGVNNQDHPVVAYHDMDDDVVVATLTAGGWSRRAHSVVGSPPADGISLAFDSVDAPHVAYASSNGLDVLRFNILSVTTQTAVSGIPVTIGPHAMAIDEANRIRIAYVNDADQSLHLATSDFGWVTTQLDAGIIGPTPSLALDAQGRWAVACHDDTNGRVKLIGQTSLLGKPADFDCDGDVDGDDYLFFESCATGPGLSQNGPACLVADFDADDDVDQEDFGVFQHCHRGAGVPSDPNCAD